MEMHLCFRYRKWQYLRDATLSTELGEMINCAGNKLGNLTTEFVGLN